MPKKRFVPQVPPEQEPATIEYVTNLINQLKDSVVSRELYAKHATLHAPGNKDPINYAGTGTPGAGTGSGWPQMKEPATKATPRMTAKALMKSRSFRASRLAREARNISGPRPASPGPSSARAPRPASAAAARRRPCRRRGTPRGRHSSRPWGRGSPSRWSARTPSRPGA